MDAVKKEVKTPVVGRSVIRKDALEKLTGRAQYAADLTRPGMLHVVTVRAPAARMTNLRIDDQAARNLPGVVRIATMKDIPGANAVPLVFLDQPFLAESEVRFHAEAVALVAAETYPEAVAAAAAVTVTGAELTPCLDPLAALSSDAPLIYGDNNVFKSYDIERGDPAADFARADIVLEREYRTPHQVHGYLETQGMLAELDDTGGIRITGSMQCPFYVQDAVAAILGWARHRVTVIQSATGGGFGGKEDVPSIVAGHAALMAYLTKRPVRLIYRREEDFRTMSKRHPSVTRIKIAATRAGKLLAADVDYILNGGAYATLSPIVLWRGAVHAAGPYTWNSVKINARAVATNTVPCGAYRGFGQPQVTFAIESIVDEMAAELNMDPLAFRRKNIIGIGDVTATNHKITASCGMAEALDRGSDSIEWSVHWKPPEKFSPAQAKLLRGVGCSVSFYGVGLGAGGKHLARAGAFVQVEIDGSVRIYIGNTEMGQGARSVISQIAAETLNAPYEKVMVHRADTSRVPDSGPTVASRTTIMSGGAVMDACRKILEHLKCASADLAGCVREEIETCRGGFCCAGVTPVSYEESVKHAYGMRLPMSVTGWYVSPDTSFDENGQGDAYMTYVWSANFAEVLVDPVTLEVTVVKLAAAHDVGKAINPREVAGQIQGGALQGLGYALMEDLRFDADGRMLNPGFEGYIMPTAYDAPEIDPIIVEHPFENGPYGAKGIGEPPLIGVAPAVANAVFNATGIRVRMLPLCPEKILTAVRRGE